MAVGGRADRGAREACSRLRGGAKTALEEIRGPCGRGAPEIYTDLNYISRAKYPRALRD